MADSSSTKPREPLFLLLGLVLVIACLYWARQILIPIALAILLSFILTPAVSALQRRGLGRIPSVLLVVLLAFVLLGGIAWVISMQIGSLLSNLSLYQGRITAKLES